MENDDVSVDLIVTATNPLIVVLHFAFIIMKIFSFIKCKLSILGEVSLVPKFHDSVACVYFGHILPVANERVANGYRFVCAAKPPVILIGGTITTNESHPIVRQRLYGEVLAYRVTFNRAINEP